MLSVERWDDEMIYISNSETCEGMHIHKLDIYTIMRMLAGMAKSLELEDPKEKTWNDA